METFIAAAVIFAVPVAIAIRVVWRIFRPVARERIPAHRGEFQSQRGRVYNWDATSHNAAPSDGTGGSL
ncbi:hypothetical protein [Arthrobacter sp. SAFR-044]|uniref:hypothetical protein n=1 Tax=Arthrobacter sp. SAFR-044 TaxID=3387278 RepID=UPI003F7CBC61